MKQFTLVEYPLGGTARMALTGIRRVQFSLDLEKKLFAIEEQGSDAHIEMQPTSGIQSISFKAKFSRLTRLQTFEAGDTYIVNIVFHNGTHARYVWDSLWSRDATGTQTEHVESFRDACIDAGIPNEAIRIHTRNWMYILFFVGMIGVAWFTFFY